MVHLKGMISFLCVFLAFGQSVDFEIPPSSPCPAIFEYFYKNGRLYGIVTVNNKANHSQVDVKVTFSVDETIATDDIGYINLLDNKATVIEKVKNGSSILFLVNLPQLILPPKLMEIRFDDIVVCRRVVHKRQLPGHDNSRMTFNYRSSDINGDPEINSIWPEESSNDRTHTRRIRTPDGNTVKKEWSSNSSSPDGSSSTQSWGYSSSKIVTTVTDGTDIEGKDFIDFNKKIGSFFDNDFDDINVDDITLPTNLLDKFRSLSNHSKIGSNQNPVTQPQYPIQQSTYQQQQSPYQPTQFQYPQPQSQYQPQQPQYSVPNLQYPPQQSQYPVPNSQYPPQQSQYPVPNSQYQPQQSQYPVPNSQYPPQQSQYQPQPLQYPQPQSQYPPQQDRYPPSTYTQQYTPVYPQSPQQGFAPTPYQQPSTVSTSRLPQPLSQTFATPTAARNGEISRPQFTNDDLGCGIANVNTLFIKGEETKKGDWPWLVAMYIKKPSSLDFQCAGTLVSHKHVVTAAHCINGKSNRPYTVHEVIIKVGVFNLQDWTDSDVKQLGVSNITTHPRYTGGLSHLDDIAIFVLVRPVEYSNVITPACLWDGAPDLSLVVGKNGTVVGWGRDENGLVATPEPRAGKVPIVSTQTCRASLAQFARLTSDSTLCAGARDGTGPCNGDSGGGMYISIQSKWYLRAIVSLSLPGDEMPCNLKEYVVYTDTAQYLSWIKKIMDENP